MNLSASQVFLRKQLDNLIFHFPSIQVKYELDAFDNTHFIEITPTEIFTTDTRLADYLSNLDQAFSNKFPDELIAFLTEDATFQLENISYIKTGIFYGIDTKSIAVNLPILKDKFTMLDKMDFSTLNSLSPQPFSGKVTYSFNDIKTKSNPIPFSSTNNSTASIEILHSELAA